MNIIQIDITNACVNKCSNCTRFCGHHKKTFFMDFETFKKAVDSFEGYEGHVGIIGGEPTIHPEFEKFADYLREKRVQKTCSVSREPIYDMLKHIYTNLTYTNKKVGLWSSLSKSYYKHFETINDTFERQLLNDHDNTCLHQALLMSRKDLGISDEEWIPKRDACWIQNTWSATVTPKGAFFCEVAGALDMLFDGPGGWPVEKGWWKRKVEDFGDQLKWCEICSGCLDVPQRLSTDGRDDVSPSVHKMLLDIKSPKALKGECVVHNPETFDKSKYKTFIGSNDYMEAAGNKKTSKNNRNLYPRSFAITNDKDLKTFVQQNKPKDWIITCDDKSAAKKIAKELSDFIINPGVLYEYKNAKIFNVLARSIRDNLDDLSKPIESYYPEEKIIKIEQKLPKDHSFMEKISLTLDYLWKYKL